MQICVATSKMKMVNSWAFRKSDERLIQGKPLLVNNEIGGFSKVLGKWSYLWYMRKNIFRYGCQQSSKFDQESQSDNRVYIELLPDGFREELLSQPEITADGIKIVYINDEKSFWQIPNRKQRAAQRRYFPRRTLMKITDLKCAIIGRNPVVRINTDEGIYGYGEAEGTKPYLKPHVLFYKDIIMGADPTNVEGVMMRIRNMASFKPWGSAVSAIEMALWDIAGKAAGIPVYKLLGGKVRDKVRVYNGGIRFPMKGASPEDYAENVAKMKASPEGFSFIKQAIGFHGGMPRTVPGFYYGETELNPTKP